MAYIQHVVLNICHAEYPSGGDLSFNNIPNAFVTLFALLPSVKLDCNLTFLLNVLYTLDTTNITSASDYLRYDLIDRPGVLGNYVPVNYHSLYD